MIRYVLLMFMFFSCTSEKKDFLEINNLWMLIDSDSVYYEFYFDDYQVFTFDSKSEMSGSSDYDTLSFNKFKEEMLTNKSVIEDSISVLTYFCENFISGSKKIIRIEPLGSLFYRFSYAPYNNRMLFGSEADIRYCLRFNRKTYFPFPFFGFDTKSIDKNIMESTIYADTLITYGDTGFIKEVMYYYKPYFKMVKDTNNYSYLSK